MAEDPGLDALGEVPDVESMETHVVVQDDRDIMTRTMSNDSPYTVITLDSHGSYGGTNVCFSWHVPAVVREQHTPTYSFQYPLFYES